MRLRVYNNLTTLIQPAQAGLMVFRCERLRQPQDNLQP
jgi:hypothetical protein